VLEGGLGAAGTQEFFSFVDRVSPVTRVCTYDRAGTGSSDPRPDDAGPVTAGLMASEIHALLDAISVDAPVVIAAHSYGGMPARAFAGTYPGEVAGLVLIDVSSEPEIPLYRRLHAGPWIDHDDRIDIGTTVKELSAAGGLDDLPLVVVTAELIEDRWLATEATLAARAQTRLAGLSSNRIHVVATGSGHLVQRRRSGRRRDRDPRRHRGGEERIAARGLPGSVRRPGRDVRPARRGALTHAGVAHLRTLEVPPTLGRWPTRSCSWTRRTSTKASSRSSERQWESSRGSSKRTRLIRSRIRSTSATMVAG
jgi:pimeloyl-ACP methyl ester carboxylesterase